MLGAKKDFCVCLSVNATKRRFRINYWGIKILWGTLIFLDVSQHKQKKYSGGEVMDTILCES